MSELMGSNKLAETDSLACTPLHAAIGVQMTVRKRAWSPQLYNSTYIIPLYDWRFFFLPRHRMWHMNTFAFNSFQAYLSF